MFMQMKVKLKNVHDIWLLFIDGYSQGCLHDESLEKQSVDTGEQWVTTFACAFVYYEKPD